MRKALLYQTSIAVCGSALGISGVLSLSSGGGPLVPLLQVITGFVMIGSVTDDVIVADEPPLPDERIVWFVAICALVVVATGVLPVLT